MDDNLKRTKKKEKVEDEKFLFLPDADSSRLTYGKGRRLRQTIETLDEGLRNALLFIGDQRLVLGFHACICTLCKREVIRLRHYIRKSNQHYNIPTT